LRHVVLGAGAVGGLIGAVLAHEGDDVTVLVRTESSDTPVKSRHRSESKQS
jgi:ketopantoate reductase